MGPWWEGEDSNLSLLQNGFTVRVSEPPTLPSLVWLSQEESNFYLTIISRLHYRCAMGHYLEDTL